VAEATEEDASEEEEEEQKAIPAPLDLAAIPEAVIPETAPSTPRAPPLPLPPPAKITVTMDYPDPAFVAAMEKENGGPLPIHELTNRWIASQKLASWEKREAELLAREAELLDALQKLKTAAPAVTTTTLPGATAAAPASITEHAHHHDSLITQAQMMHAKRIVIDF
jgi:hypothetical protein